MEDVDMPELPEPGVGPNGRKLPVVILTIGMAGSGKTRFVHRLYTKLVTEKKAVYTINLDPAVKLVPTPSNIDIRDTVNYKEVMKHFQLGPNGGIMTSLNLFATRFDQVLKILDERAPGLDYIIVDTPGQIEVFNWSASGSIIADSLAVSFPTVACYIVDTVRCRRPVTFMSNMLYSCSILYRTKLPIVMVFNKTDVCDHQFAAKWMEDFEDYQEALAGETSYMASLSRSMSLVMEEFYSTMRSAGVSSATGRGFDDFLVKLHGARDEFVKDYIPYLQQKQKELEDQREKFLEERKQEMSKAFSYKPDSEKEATMNDADEYEKMVAMLAKAKVSESEQTVD